MVGHHIQCSLPTVMSETPQEGTVDIHMRPGLGWHIGRPNPIETQQCHEDQWCLFNVDIQVKRTGAYLYE